MQRFLLLSLLIYGLVLAGLTTLNGELIALSIPLLIYLGASLLFQPEEFRLTLSRELSATQVYPHDVVEVKVTITNEGAPLEEVFIADLIPDQLEILDGQTSLITPLPAEATVELTYRLKGRRGDYEFDRVQVTARDRFGLFAREQALAAPGRLLILPDVIRLRRVEIRPRQTGVYSGLIPARQGGPGVEFFGVRTYQPGDPLRWINSRATARHAETIYINEFEQERIADVGLILDARLQSNVRGDGDASLFEYSIQATAALADVFLNGGNRVGLFIYGRSLNWTFPGYGKIQRRRILQVLARAEQGEGSVFERLDHLPARLFPAKSQLVLISPLLGHDVEMLIRLRARGYHLLVVSPDPVTFEEKGLPAQWDIKLAVRVARLERALLLDQLRQAGIRVLDWQVETPLAQAVSTTIGQFQPF